MNKTNQSVIKTQNLSKYYGSSRGVLNLDLNIKEGEIFGFLGPNGAGKTTTIRLLLGLMKPSQGTIRIFGKKIPNQSKIIWNDIGYLPGDFGLYRELSGRDFINHLLKIRNLYDLKTIKNNTERLIRKFGFNLKDKIKTYSKGMKQIVGIIQAFCHDPNLVILDEPTLGLDPLAQETFYNLLNQEKEKGRTVFLSSHILKEVERVCDRTAIIREGRLVFVEDLKKYRSLVGKKITLELRKENSPNIMDHLKRDFSLQEIRSTEKRIEFFYKGEIPKLLNYLSKIKTNELLIEVPTLEDVFLTFYKKDKENA